MYLDGRRGWGKKRKKGGRRGQKSKRTKQTNKKPRAKYHFEKQRIKKKKGFFMNKIYSCDAAFPGKTVWLKLRSDESLIENLFSFPWKKKVHLPLLHLPPQPSDFLPLYSCIFLSVLCDPFYYFIITLSVPAWSFHDVEKIFSSAFFT